MYKYKIYNIWVCKKKSDTYLVYGQLIGVPLSDALLAFVHHCDLNVGALGGHHAARRSANVSGSNAAYFRNANHDNIYLVLFYQIKPEEVN